MFTETLANLIRNDIATTAELAKVGKVDVSTVSRYVTGESEPRLTTLNRWAVGLQSDRARRAIAGVVLEDSDMIVVMGDKNLDVNGDGKIDVLDAVEATGAAIRHLAPEIEALLAAMQNGGRVPVTLPTAFMDQASEAITCIKQAIAVIQQVPTEAERRKARQPGDVGANALKIVGAVNPPPLNGGS